MAREQTKGQELEGIIEEYRMKIEALEKKGREMQTIIKKQSGVNT